MTMVHTLVLIAHVIVGAMIIGLVLLQRGKGAEAGAAFGAGASATVFGAKGSANFLSRSTAILASVFFATSLGLAYLGAQRPVTNSIIEAPAEDTGPATQPAPDTGRAELPELPAPPSAPSGGPSAPPAGNTPAAP
jgi:preprotein translocase subunit SecG